MRAPRIELLPRRDWLRIALWVSAAICMCLAAALLWRGALMQGQLERKAADLYAQTSAVEASSQDSPPGPHRAEAAAFAEMAGYDPAAKMRLLERVTVPGTRLISVQIDAQAKSTRAEFEIARALAASELLAALNAGEETPTWEMQVLQPSSHASGRWNLSVLSAAAQHPTR